MKQVQVKYFIYIAAAISMISCTKSSYLDAKPDASLLIPTTIADYQKLLDNDLSSLVQVTPFLGEAATDNYYYEDGGFVGDFLYNEDVYALNDKQWTDGLPIEDWFRPYKVVFTANVAIEGLSKLTANSSQQVAYNNVQGSALFLRAHSYYQLAQVFCAQYDSTNANATWGIPLRATSDINETITRSTIKQTYDQIIGDLQRAKDLLPVTPDYKNRPSKPAVLGLLARVYQTMQKYDSALYYADASLQLKSDLLDYNTLDPSAYLPFARYNKEVLYHCTMYNSAYLPIYDDPRFSIDTVLYNTYVANDLRKKLFFDVNSGTGYYFKGTYDNVTGDNFTGVTTDEMYLVRAESYARKGKTTEALSDLNKLLITRWKTGTFVPFTAATSQQALSLILTERRKELIFRGLRWTDLRRLNKEGAGITINRTVNGQHITLLPNSLHYIYLIPQQVLDFNADMPQNPR